MVDWKSPETIVANAASLKNLLHTLLGIYLWEWSTSLDFEWMYISGQRQVRWPTIFYFYGRYSMLVGLVGVIVSMDIGHEIDCQRLIIATSAMGNSAQVAASINLAIRTMAIWNQKRSINTLLILLILLQLGLTIRPMFANGVHYIPEQGCTPSIDTEIYAYATMYIYTMIVDLIIVVLMAYKLVIQPRRMALEYPATMAATRRDGGTSTRSTLVRFLFKDGVAYFIVAFICNLIAAVFSLLSLNPVMSLIADVPASTFSTIVACRVVRRLYYHKVGGTDIE